MKTDTYCSKCVHKESCREVYGKLGKYEGPSVTRDVIVAFVLPVVVFVAAATACQWLLRDLLQDRLLILANVAVGTGLSLLFIFAARTLRNRFTKKHCI